MPCLDQSGRRHVALPGAKISTPRLISSTMSFFDRSNAASMSSDHFKFCFRREQVAHLGHVLSELSVVRHLVDQAEPRPDVSDAFGFGEVPDRVEVLGEWLHRRRGDFESSEFHLLLAKLEFVRVEDDARVAREFQVVDGPPLARWTVSRSSWVRRLL